MLLLTYNPEEIVNFCARHPLNMCDEYRKAVLPGGPGNVRSPTPAADVFFRMLKERDGELMTQREYWERCVKMEWIEWYDSLKLPVQKAFGARIYRLFYPSFIDSLHVWALLGTRYYWDGKAVFDRCLIDTKKDVITKTDLLLYRGDKRIRIALTVNTKAALEVNSYKHKKRGGHIEGTVEIKMRVGKRYRGAGNKCWYQYPKDFEPIMRRAEQLFLFQKESRDAK